MTERKRQFLPNMQLHTLTDKDRPHFKVTDMLPESETSNGTEVVSLAETIMANLKKDEPVNLTSMQSILAALQDEIRQYEAEAKRWRERAVQATLEAERFEVKALRAINALKFLPNS